MMMAAAGQNKITLEQQRIKIAQWAYFCVGRKIISCGIKLLTCGNHVASTAPFPKIVPCHNID